jgi:hypothetical protein
LRHDPAPSHVPSSSQVEASSAVQVPLGSTVPAETSEHTPRKPGTLHALHLPQLSELQQTPFVHLPVRHWGAEAQAAPCGFFWQIPPTHVLGETHWASLVQLDGQIPALQT